MTPAQLEFRLGVRESLPLGLALVPIGLAFGYVAVQAGLAWWLATLMAAVVYAGPSQFLAASLIVLGAGTPAIVATTGVANLRYVLFSTSLVPYLSDAPPRRLLALAHGVADGSYALLIRHCLLHPARPAKDAYLLGSFLVSFWFWVPATVAGGLLGDALPPLLAYGLDFATPAIFTAFLVGSVRSVRAVAVAAVAGIGTVVGNEHLPRGAGPVVAMLTAAVLGGLVEWRRAPRSS